MVYHLSVSTWIIPYNSQEGKLGFPYASSVAFDFEEEDILEEMELEIAHGEGQKTYFRLSLGENSSDYDSYLVEKKDVLVKG